MKRNESIKSLIQRAIVHFGRVRLRNHLLGCSDHVLEDIGFSRHLLEQGVDAWPWRVTMETGLRPARVQTKDNIVNLNYAEVVEQAEQAVEQHAKAA